jgi:hypothetical protein
MLEELLKLDDVFGCLKVDKELKALADAECPRRIQCALRSSAGFKGIEGISWYSRYFVRPKMSSDICGIMKNRKYHQVLEEP